jgi:hypothetical protein
VLADFDMRTAVLLSEGLAACELLFDVLPATRGELAEAVAVVGDRRGDAFLVNFTVPDALLLSVSSAALRVGVIARVAALGVGLGAATVPRGDIFPDAFVSPLLTTVLAPVDVTDLIGDAFLTAGALLAVTVPTVLSTFFADAAVFARGVVVALLAVTAPTDFSTFFADAAVFARGFAVASSGAVEQGASVVASGELDEGTSVVACSTFSILAAKFRVTSSSCVEFASGSSSTNGTSASIWVAAASSSAASFSN